MSTARKYPFLNYLIAAVWLVNGLVCKLLNLVPRHQEIVAQILGADHARLLTILIGISEILMAIWILSGIQPRLCAVVQVLVIGTMNSLEFFLVPGLLLWGKMNAVFAFMFILLTWYNGFYGDKEVASPKHVSLPEKPSLRR